jgi:hypothetical protein
MIRKLSVRRRSGARLLAAALGPVAALAFAAPAMAGKPTGEFANFTNCPLKHTAILVCVYAKTTSGEFKIGSTTVPLTKPTTLQGGLAEVSGGSEFVDAEGGETLSKTPQTVPGGLFKIIAPSWLPGFLQVIFNEAINKGFTGVTATTELVGTPTLSVEAAISGKGTALGLPVRVHLENVFLGSGCYVGSASHPIVVDLTSGTTSPPPPNTPITGSPGELEFKAGGALIIDKNNSFVNNSFAAPEAEGCGGFFSFLIDPAVDAEIGLPSAAGHNTAILNGSQELAAVAAVEASE